MYLHKLQNKFLLNSYKLPLKKQSKVPQPDKWSVKNDGDCHKNYTKAVPSTKNFGVLCGRINNCIVLDLDFYEWSDDHIFYKFIKSKNLLQWATQQNTLVVRTTSEGLHLYYKLNNNPLTKKISKKT